ncbi:MAG TPA: PDZ domain-containing protein [Anaerolineae bacterium]|nr:PDZ domain-containing protein [Anaerolineae bacterium]
MNSTNSTSTWKWVGLVCLLLVVGGMCCLMGLCLGSVMGLAVGQRIETGSYSEDGHAPPEWEPYAPEESLRPWLGVYFQMTPEGALVTDVVIDSPAERAGLESGDVIIEFDGQAVTEEQPLDVIVAQYAPGDEVTVVALRGDAEREFTVTLGVFPGMELLPSPEYFDVPPFDEG